LAYHQILELGKLSKRLFRGKVNEAMGAFTGEKSVNGIKLGRQKEGFWLMGFLFCSRR
jgi:hypothetical protein